MVGEIIIIIIIACVFVAVSNLSATHRGVWFTSYSTKYLAFFAAFRVLIGVQCLFLSSAWVTTFSISSLMDSGPDPDPNAMTSGRGA